MVLKEHKTSKNRFTRMIIGEAIIELMKKKKFEKLNISEIAKKAGVSRMTYYNYFETKEDVLNDYLGEIIIEYINECNQHPEIGLMLEYKHILFSLMFFDKYASFFLTLANAGLYSIIINATNDFMLMHMNYDYDGSVYELYCYAGALLNMFIKWEEKE